MVVEDRAASVFAFHYVYLIILALEPHWLRVGWIHLPLNKGVCLQRCRARR